MHSFLIVSKNRQTALDYSIAECIKNKINKFDISILSFDKAIGIEDVRSFQKKLYLKPFVSKDKAIVLEGFNGITIEAQNSLLKLLEEPPVNTIVYTTVPNKELLLPTILSRCKIIELKDKVCEPSKQELSQYLNILISLSSIGVGEKIKLAQDIAKNKEYVIPWLEKLIIVAREELVHNIRHSGIPMEIGTIESPDGDPIATLQDDITKTTQYLNLLKSLQKTYTILKSTNVNPRFALENLFLNL